MTDLNMPGHSGLELARELLAIRPHIPIILCSGAISKELKESARLVGIRDVLYKPTDLAELCDSLHRRFAK